jgi:hypothetical protein
MKHAIQHLEQRKATGSLSGLVIAAIGFQLLLCTAASAANACSASIDRIPSTVALAIREISDRHSNIDHASYVVPTGYTLSDCNRSTLMLTHDECIDSHSIYLLFGLIDLPPPAMG